jgi:hypothetical protein
MVGVSCRSGRGNELRFRVIDSITGLQCKGDFVNERQSQWPKTTLFATTTTDVHTNRHFILQVEQLQEEVSQLKKEKALLGALLAGTTLVSPLALPYSLPPQLWFQKTVQRKMSSHFSQQIYRLLS